MRFFKQKRKTRGDTLSASVGRKAVAIITACAAILGGGSLALALGTGGRTAEIVRGGGSGSSQHYIHWAYQDDEEHPSGFGIVGHLEQQADGTYSKVITPEVAAGEDNSADKGKGGMCNVYGDISGTANSWNNYTLKSYACHALSKMNFGYSKTGNPYGDISGSTKTKTSAESKVIGAISQAADSCLDSQKAGLTAGHTPNACRLVGLGVLTWSGVSGEWLIDSSTADTTFWLQNWDSNLNTNNGADNPWDTIRNDTPGSTDNHAYDNKEFWHGGDYTMDTDDKYTKKADGKTPMKIGEAIRNQICVTGGATDNGIECRSSGDNTGTGNILVIALVLADDETTPQYTMRLSTQAHVQLDNPDKGENNDDLEVNDANRDRIEKAFGWSNSSVYDHITTECLDDNGNVIAASNCSSGIQGVKAYLHFKNQVGDELTREVPIYRVTKTEDCTDGGEKLTYGVADSTSDKGYTLGTNATDFDTKRRNTDTYTMGGCDATAGDYFIKSDTFGSGSEGWSSWQFGLYWWELTVDWSLNQNLKLVDANGNEVTGHNTHGDDPSESWEARRDVSGETKKDDLGTNVVVGGNGSVNDALTLTVTPRPQYGDTFSGKMILRYSATGYGGDDAIDAWADTFDRTLDNTSPSMMGFMVTWGENTVEGNESGVGVSTSQEVTIHRDSMGIGPVRPSSLATYTKDSTWGDGWKAGYYWWDWQIDQQDWMNAPSSDDIASCSANTAYRLCLDGSGDANERFELNPETKKIRVKLSTQANASVTAGGSETVSDALNAACYEEDGTTGTDCPADLTVTGTPMLSHAEGTATTAAAADFGWYLALFACQDRR